MQAFILNPHLSRLDVQNVINQKLTQLRSLANCLLLANAEVSAETRYGVIWTMDGLLEEIDSLCNISVS